MADARMRRLRAAVEAAIRQVDRQEGQNVEEDGAATWIPAAFQFTRHDPYEYGSINYLMDSGKVLTKVSWPEESNGVERCREVVRAMIGRRTAISTLADVARDSEVVNLAAELEEAAPGCFPSGFRSLVIFCRWKELFHRWREAVDAEALTAEARELIAADVDYWSVRESLWLLGCFAGHERVAHLRYAAEGHPWWCGPKLSISKIAGPAAVTRRESEVERDATECTAVEAEKASKESASVICRLSRPSDQIGASTGSDGVEHGKGEAGEPCSCGLSAATLRAELLHQGVSGANQSSKMARRIVTDSDAFSSARTNRPPPAWATRCMNVAASG